MTTASTLHRGGPLPPRRHGQVLAVVFFVTAACAHAPSALIITGSTLDAAGITMESVEAGMRSASDARELTREQVLAWNDFLARWKVGYPDACAAWRAAKAKQDDSSAEQAAAALAVLIGQLNDWASVVAKVPPRPSSYELPREEPQLVPSLFAGGSL